MQETIAHSGIINQFVVMKQQKLVKSLALSLSFISSLQKLFSQIEHKRVGFFCHEQVWHFFLMNKNDMFSEALLFENWRLQGKQ